MVADSSSVITSRTFGRIDEIPRRRYAMIAVDPPWSFKSFTPLTAANWSHRRDADKHYRTMPLDEIKALPVRELSAPNAWLWLWTTGPFLEHAFDVLSAWGFSYSAMGLVWIKLSRGATAETLAMRALEDAMHMGPGHTTRHNAEFALLAKRGSPRRLARDVRELVFAPVRDHSRKPDEAIERMTRFAAGPRLEMFARRTYPGWDAFGDTITAVDGPYNKRGK